MWRGSDVIHTCHANYDTMCKLWYHVMIARQPPYVVSLSIIRITDDGSTEAVYIHSFMFCYTVQITAYDNA